MSETKSDFSPWQLVDFLIGIPLMGLATYSRILLYSYVWRIYMAPSVGFTPSLRLFFGVATLLSFVTYGMRRTKPKDEKADTEKNWPFLLAFVESAFVTAFALLLCWAFTKII
jgi:hypothetical protein